jgi:hypothetical protein
MQCAVKEPLLTDGVLLSFHVVAGAAPTIHTLLNEPRVIYLPSKERNFALLLYFP